MHKKLYVGLLFFVFCMFTGINVYAECDTKEINALKQEAYNIKLTYEYIEGSYDESNYAQFYVRAANLSENIKLKYGGHYYTYDSKREIPSLSNINGSFIDDTTYTFSIYASSNTGCDNTFLITKSIKLPNFNEYSVRSECEGLNEYDYCQRWYSGNIKSEEDFLAKIEQYKNNGDVGEIEEKENFITEIINWILENLAIVVPIAVLVLIVATYIIIDYVVRKRKRKRIKI